MITLNGVEISEEALNRELNKQGKKIVFVCNGYGQTIGSRFWELHEVLDICPVNGLTKSKLVTPCRPIPDELIRVYEELGEILQGLCFGYNQGYKEATMCGPRANEVIDFRDKIAAIKAGGRR